ncbi:hypothetical protein [Chryseobacterium mucoviscidosis]|uniref:hypothetical protein n=1 Tax=Chryseobacterium mucoviscidosis TaxID=1945581 RepID=UPI0031D84DF4
MELKLENVHVIYPDEISSSKRNLVIQVDLEGETLNFDLLDKNGDFTNFSLDKKQISVLRDYLSSILKNKIIE